jgi:hypothetical protein
MSNSKEQRRKIETDLHARFVHPSPSLKKKWGNDGHKRGADKMYSTKNMRNGWTRVGSDKNLRTIMGNASPMNFGTIRPFDKIFSKRGKHILKILNCLESNKVKICNGNLSSQYVIGIRKIGIDFLFHAYMILWRNEVSVQHEYVQGTFPCWQLGQGKLRQIQDENPIQPGGYSLLLT